MGSGTSRASQPVHQQAAGLQNRARARHHHDGEHEQRLGEVARLKVLQRVGLAGQGEHGHSQHHGPKPKHHLDFAQQVPHPGVARMLVGELLEVFGAEGVQYCQRKNAGCDPGQEAVVHVDRSPMANAKRCGGPTCTQPATALLPGDTRRELSRYGSARKPFSTIHKKNPV